MQSHTMEIRPARTTPGHRAWTPEMVEICIQEAAGTIKHSDSLRRIFPAQFRSFWPEIADRGLALIDQKGLKPDPPRILPGASAIDRANAVLAWRALVPPGDWDLLLLRAGGVKWATIERFDGRTRRALLTRYKAGLLAIATAISSDSKIALPIS